MPNNNYKQVYTFLFYNTNPKKFMFYLLYFIVFTTKPPFMHFRPATYPPKKWDSKAFTTWLRWNSFLECKMFWNSK